MANEISEIRLGFVKWLEQKNGVQEGTLDEDISIFEYSDEFKEYIDSEYDVNDSVMSMNMSDILDLEISDGKLVLPDDEAVEDGEENNKDKSEIVDILNNLFEDDEFKTMVDANGDNVLSDEEISEYLDTISRLDGNKDDISLSDIMEAIETASDKIEKTKLAQQITQSSPISSSGFSGYYGNSVPQINTKSKTEAELKQELSTAKATLTEKQNSLNAAIDGSDPELQALQKNIDTAYDTYQQELKKVDEDMAQELDDLKTAKDAKQKEINDVDKNIVKQEGTVQDCENSLADAKATQQTLESSLTKLETADTSKMSASQKSNIESQKAELKQKCANAEKAVVNAQTALDEAKAKLSEYKEKKEKLESGEGGLKSIQDSMTELEGRISAAYPVINQYMQAYKDAQQTYDTTRANKISSAQKAVSTAQSNVNKIETELTQVRTKAIENKYALNEYNAEAGQKLANQALNVDGTHGWCLAGVSKNLQAVYGGNGLAGLGSAYMARDALRGLTPGYEATASHFKEIQVSQSELKDLPAGSIVVWQDFGNVHGHIAIMLGNGMESSDHIQEFNPYSYGTDFNVFVPIS